HLDPERLEPRSPAAQLLLLAGPVELGRGGVGVAVVADLVPARDDPADALRVPLGDPPRHEEGGGHAASLEDLEEARDGDLRAVRALREDAGPVGVRRVLANPDFLRV